FTIIHDIGRMMVGSGASEFRYPELDGSLLHPVIGALMLTEAFSQLPGAISGKVRKLLKALEYTAERHTRSIGLTRETVKKWQLAKLERYNRDDSL
ncbi:hypothetical protein, partial [Klebsiella pneumoniae]|uniref:hypothetical protein n=1 Tax=Klebsiella pneumoniae TaxID=573 RepID=UPI003017672D